MLSDVFNVWLIKIIRRSSLLSRFWLFPWKASRSEKTD